MKRLIARGLASQRLILSVDITYADYEETLMNLLLKNGIPVASSCGGEGICKKCIVTLHDESILSCQKTIRDLFSKEDVLELTFSYL